MATVMVTFRQTLIAVLFVVTAVMPPWPAAADDADLCSKESGDAAIAACGRAITSGIYNGNNLANLFLNRGVEYSSKGDNDRAIQDYDQAIRLNPKHANTFYNRGVAYRSKGQYDRAIADYDQAIRLNPQDADFFFERGVAYGLKGQYDRAISNYNEAIRLDPQHASAIKYRQEATAKKKQ